MYDILDISRYVLYYAKKCGHGLSVLQLMKILYFVQAQFLISRKKRAFSDEIVAMDWGPVERKVWSHYKSCGNGYIPVLLGINFVKEEKDHHNCGCGYRHLSNCRSGLLLRKQE